MAPARDAFVAAGLDATDDDAVTLALKGRLLKDAAGAATAEERGGLLAQAAEAYATAARLSPAATYPLINAATLAFLSGNRALAQAHARETLALLDGGAHEPDTAYWLAATRAEALLLLGHDAQARAALDAAIAGTPLAWEDHAVTLRQFRRILGAQAKPADWLDARRPPPAVHFAGPIGIRPHDARLEASLARVAEGFGGGTATGALAAGFDIAAAEALHRAGMRLQIVLPARIDSFVEASVRPAGGDWLTRFEALIAAAYTLDEIDTPAGLSAAAAVLAEEMALGCAMIEARSRDAEAVMLRLAGAGTGAAAGSGGRLVTVSGDALAIEAHWPELAPPARPIALLGCRHASAHRLGELTGAAEHLTPTGVYAVCDSLTVAAAAGLALFDGSAEGQVVLDYALPYPDGTPDTAALDTLLEMSGQRYPIATRAAALTLASRGAPITTAPAGASGGLAPSVEFFSLWGDASARRSDRKADAAN